MYLLGEGVQFCLEFTPNGFFLRLRFACGSHPTRPFLRRIYFFGHTVYPNAPNPARKVIVGAHPLDCANALGDGLGIAYFSRFAHLAFAAFNARSLRSSGVNVSRLRFPPIFPPFLPIADMTREMSCFDGLRGCAMIITSGLSSSDVDRWTCTKAAWLMSSGLLLRFSFILQVCHVCQPSQNESSPLPNVIDRRHGRILTLTNDSRTRFYPDDIKINIFRPPFAIHDLTDVSPITAYRTVICRMTRS